MTRTLISVVALCIEGMAISASLAQAPGYETGFKGTDGIIRTWKRSEGLPSDSVNAIIQTRDGFLWVGTSAGLVRFDGVNFTNVPLSGPGTNASITALCEDSAGQLWVGANGLFQLAKGRITRFTRASGLLDENITCLAAGNDGLVWIGTRSGLNVAAGSDLKSFTVRDGLPDDWVTGLHVARSGSVWITTRAGMCQYQEPSGATHSSPAIHVANTGGAEARLEGRIVPYELQTDSQGRSPEYLGVYEDRQGNLWAFGDTYLINLAEGKRFNHFRVNEAAAMRIWSLCEGRDGRLWIGTSGRGLVCFAENRFQPVLLGDLRWSFDVRAIFEDREGDLWLGTSGGGLVQWQPQRVEAVHSAQGLPVGVPTALALDAGDHVYLGFEREGLYVGENGRFEPFTSASSPGVRFLISSTCVARDGTIWVGTMGGGLYGLRNGSEMRMTTADGLADNAVLSVCSDSDTNVWVSTGAGVIHCFSATNSFRFAATHELSGSPVSVMIPSGAGGIWLGTQDGAILRALGGKFEQIPAGNRLGSRAILALQEGQTDELWIGTSGGLACWTRNRMMVWNAGNGLPNDYVAGIVLDGAGNLWLVTGAGIFCASRSAVQKSLADPQVPLMGRVIADVRTRADYSSYCGPRTARAADGRLWFATSEGVVNIDTRRPRVEGVPVPFYLESISFNGDQPISVLQDVAWPQVHTNINPVIAPGDLRSVEVRFTALSFSAPEKVRFRHRLEGFDPDWIDDGMSRLARYGRLPYGNYRFRAGVRVADGAWQDATPTFSVYVPAPLYRRNWAIAMYCLAAAGLVAGVVRVVSHRRLRAAVAQLEQQQVVERERMRIARDMHDEIGAKLTKISFLSEHARKQVKTDMQLSGKISVIAETSRELLKAMDEIVWAVNPRNDTLEHLAAYLTHYANEYFQNTTVECDLSLPQSLPHYPLSSETRHNLFLAFEESLSNVLKHSGASLVKISVIVTPPRFGIVVWDNGHGFDLAQLRAAGAADTGGSGGNGLRNIQQRLDEIGGECDISSVPGNGTRISLFIRLANGERRGIS